MPILRSRLNPDAASFQANAERMREKLAHVRALEAQVREGSAAKRDNTLAGLGMHDDDGKKSVLGGGTIIGIGVVAGKRCLISASDSALKGGTISPMGLKKGLRAQEIARDNKLPLISLVESGGANLMYQADIFVEGGRSFANQARMSAMGLPQIAVVHGSSTAGGAYLPGLSDYVILVQGRSSIYLAGPPLVKAAIGEDATDEELGGAQMHASVTGLGEYLAENDAHAIAMTREVMDKLQWDKALDTGTAPAPLYDEEELMGCIPADEREPFDTREVIARIVDGSDFLEFKANHGSETLCGHARVDGHLLCDQSGTPLVFLQNTTGFMVGKAAEHGGAIKHGSKMIQAVANARVPKFTITLGGSFGAGNYGMCGRGFDPRFIFSWPSARTAVMGGAQAAKVMEIVTRGKMERAGVPVNDAMLDGMSAEIRKRLDAEAHVLFGTARLWDDGVIDPRDTRRVLAMCVQEDGPAGPAGREVRHRLRWHGPGFLLLHGGGRRAGGHPLRRRAHGHWRADRHVHPGPAPLRQ
ncbi:unnamed protein product [Victoria cruziana]